MSRKGNICIIILPILMLIFIVIIATLIITYIQISTQLYDVKLSLDNIVMSSLSNDDLDNISYRDYNINENVLKNNIESLLEKNYLKKESKKTGITKIWCDDVRVLNINNQILKHGKYTYEVPVICVNIKLKFSPIISLLGKDKEVTIHSDIKLSLLEFN